MAFIVVCTEWDHFYKNYSVCVCMCMYILTWAHVYLNDEMIKWSTLDDGIIYEFLFLCALLYFLSFLHYACIIFITRKNKSFFFFFRKRLFVCCETEATLKELI